MFRGMNICRSGFSFSWKSFLLPLLFAIPAVANANPSRHLFDCQTTNYVHIFEGKVIDDWTRKDTSADIQEIAEFSIEIIENKLNFERTDFFNQHQYDYLKKPKTNEFPIRVLGVQHVEGYGLHTIAWWMPRFSKFGRFTYASIGPSFSVTFTAICN